MSKEREALKLALECVMAWDRGCDRDPYWRDIEAAVTAIKEALAEQPAQHDLKPKFVRNVDGVPCITLVEHEHLMNRQTAQQQEPVAEVRLIRTGGNAGLATHIVQIVEGYFPEGTKLYTSPQQHEHCIWARSGNRPCPHVQPSKPLTDEQIERCMKQAYATAQGRNLEHAFARAIEAAHGIKGDA